jgi:hypothetical protein
MQNPAYGCEASAGKDVNTNRATSVAPGQSNASKVRLHKGPGDFRNPRPVENLVREPAMRRNRPGPGMPQGPPSFTPGQNRRNGIIPHGAHGRSGDARDPPERMPLGKQQRGDADVRDRPEAADQ